MKRITIIGGGITGLVTSFHLQECAREAVEYTLIESSPRLGGKITSTHENGFTVEGGPDSFLTQKTAVLDLCRTLGLNDLLLTSNKVKQSTYVWSCGRLQAMPEGMMLMAPTMILPFLRSQLVSWPGKLRMGMEVFIPRRVKDEDESLASFVCRRLGTEALDKIAAPLMAGIHAADPATLSLRSTFPMFPEMEKKHGSLVRGMMERKREQAAHTSQHKPAPMFTTLQGGLQQLTDAIVDRLHPRASRLNCRVLKVGREGDRYRVALSDGSSLLADDVIFATPAYVTAELMQGIDPMLASKLHGIRYVSTATVSLGFKSGDIKSAPEGFGFVVPHSERRKITACSWSSAKFNHRAPQGCALMRVFIGGARAEDLAEQDEAALVELARRELRTIMGITATPVLTKTYRWHKANPQYEVGHQDRIADIEQMLQRHPGLHLAGAAYHGAGIPDCIQSGVKVAQEIAGKYSPNRSET